MLGDVVFLTISIHAPREGCDDSSHQLGVVDIISIHAPREGCDSLLVCTRSACVPFQSTHPARGATRRYVCTNEGWRFQSTHPARGATVRGGRPGSHRKNFNPRTPRGVRLLQEQEAELEQVFQSTHPARGATHRHIQGRQYSKISIHAPREGCDSSGLTRCAISHVFQSTHPARGATVFWYQPHIPQFYFNPRTPRGVRLPLFFLLKDSADFNPRTPRGVRLYDCSRKRGKYTISIHAPREGCDPIFIISPLNRDIFQSTHPARGATLVYLWPVRVQTISIHAPREGCDAQLHMKLGSFDTISIHAPREGCDICVWSADTRAWNFNPRTPRGVRRLMWYNIFININYFNPRTPRGVRRIWGVINLLEGYDFNPRTPRGVRHTAP